MSTEPEGVQDLLEQDATMWEGDEGAEEEVHEKGWQGEAAGANAQANGKAGKHLPIPAPKHKFGEAAAGQGASRQQPPKLQNSKAAIGGQQGGRRPHRYFILKSKSLFNVDQSVERGIWATQVC
jgi:hypothetical protein